MFAVGASITALLIHVRLGVRHTHIDIAGVYDFSALLPPRLPPGRICWRPRALMRLAMTFPAQHDTIKQRRIRSAPMMKFEWVPNAAPNINSGTTPALGSYEGGGYERQDEGR